MTEGCAFVQILAEIGELRREVDEDLMAAQASLDSDARADGEARAQHGDKWRAQAAATAAKPYWDRISQYRCGGILQSVTDLENSPDSAHRERRYSGRL